MKKTVKSVIAAVLALMMVLSLFGCVKPTITRVEKTTKAEASSETETVTETETQTETQTAAPLDLAKTLFIGDSRTVGIAEYTNIPADFFCDVGMSAKNSLKKTVPVKTVGKVTLEQLLTQKEYTRVYIMLGINEIGGRFESIVNDYTEVVKFVREKQPNAAIVIMANLHVTKEKSDTNPSINNPALDRFNNEVKKLADGKTTFYLDVNTVFDDEGGALKSELTSDNVHLYAKYYKEWANWILAQPLK